MMEKNRRAGAGMKQNLPHVFDKRNIKRLSAFLGMILLFSMLRVPAAAAGQTAWADTGAQTSPLRVSWLEPLEGDELEHYLDVCRLEPVTELPVQRTIECFAISKDGMIAVAFHGMDKTTIWRMDGDGNFLTGFTIWSQGDVNVGWVGDHLLAYSVRGDTAVSVEPDGTISGVYQVRNGERQFSRERERVFQGSTYRLESRLGWLAWTYSKLVRIDADGTKTVLYDSVIENVANIAWLVGFPTLCVTCIWRFFKQAKENKKKLEGADRE